MDLLIGGILEAHLPAMWGARGWGDEEQLAGVGKLEMLRLGLDGRRLAKVDLDTLAHDSFAIPNLADGNGGIDVEEGDDYAAERLERRKCVHRRSLGDEVPDLLQILRQEDVDVVEAREEQSVGGRGGLD